MGEDRIERVRQQKEKLIQKLDETRENNIKTIENTENYKALKRAVNSLEKRGFVFNVDYEHYNKIIKESYIEMKRWLRSDKSFNILEDIEKEGIFSFFDKLIEGKIVKNKRERKQELKEQRIQRIKKRIEKAIAKGDFEQEKTQRGKLEEIEQPHKYYKEMKMVLDMLEQLGAENINNEYHESYLKLAKKIRKLKLRIQRDENAEEILEFYNGFYYDMREYLINLLFTKDESISKSKVRFLKGFNGDIHIDLEHLMLLDSYEKK